MTTLLKSGQLFLEDPDKMDKGVEHCSLVHTKAPAWQHGRPGKSLRARLCGALPDGRFQLYDACREDYVSQNISVYLYICISMLPPHGASTRPLPGYSTKFPQKHLQSAGQDQPVTKGTQAISSQSNINPLKRRNVSASQHQKRRHQQPKPEAAQDSLQSLRSSFLPPRAVEGARLGSPLPAAIVHTPRATLSLPLPYP